MADQRAIDVSEIIEKQKLSRFLIGLVTISWIITFFDGLDANLVTFAAPYFRKDYGLTTVQTGNIFGLHQLGTLIGGFLMAYIGDIIGRRPAVILSTAAFGAITMSFYFAHSYGSLMGLRLIDGIPLGGMLPLAWALNIEYAPKRYRASIVTVIMIGYSLGTALGGQVANWLIPRFGWKSVFLFGGAAALLSAAVLLWRLPESIRFLAYKKQRADQIHKILRRLAPGEEVRPDAQFVVGDEPGHVKNFKPALLLQGELSMITPLIWIAYIASSFAVFFLVNWTPLVFEALGYSKEQAANSASLLSLMGALGGVLLMRFTDKRGAIAITAMPVTCTVLLLIAGLVNIGFTPFLVLNAMIGLFLIGGHFGMHSICGLFYPTAYRGNGAGWATSVAKIGSIGGPIVGGWILATSLPVRNIFAVLAICPVIFAICIYAVGRMHCRILGREAAAFEAGAQALVPTHERAG
jgi:AAHS family 4-hydroxybenzoate transporter-like MFS transporter